MTWTPTSAYLPQPEPSVYDRIQSVYGVPFAELQPPNGYRFKTLENGEPEFREPGSGELVLDENQKLWEVNRAHVWRNHSRLILEPVAPPRKRYVVTLEETGEVRFPRHGEPFFATYGQVEFADHDFRAIQRPILHVVKQEALDA